MFPGAIIEYEIMRKSTLETSIYLIRFSSLEHEYRLNKKKAFVKPLTLVNTSKKQEYRIVLSGSLDVKSAQVFGDIRWQVAQ